MLDTRLLRAFVTIVETGSFTRSAQRLNTTQSTVSQQLGRLEETLGHELISRSARPARPTAAGERLLGYARRILALEAEAQAALSDPAGATAVRIGLPEDLVTREMAQVFAQVAGPRREVRIDVVAGLSRDLNSRFYAGDLDIVVVKELAPAPGHVASFPEPIGWFEARTARPWPDPLPLVTFPPGGLYRDAMFERIEQLQRRWYVAFSGSSLESVLIAVESGLGVSLLPRAAALDRRLRACPLFGREPAMATTIYAREPSGVVGDLARAISEVLAARSLRLSRADP